MRILSRYIIREFIPPFILGFFLFTSLFILHRVLKLVSLVMEKDLPITLALKLLGLYFPFILPLAIPVAVLMATLMAFGRLAADNEILVMRACGVNLFSTILPILMIAVLLSLGTLGLNDQVAANSLSLFKDLLYEASHRSKIISIQPRTWMTLGDYLLFVNTADDDAQTMTGIQMWELSGDTRKIYAARGRWAREGDEAIVFILEDGETHHDAEAGSYYQSPFATFSFRVNLAAPTLAVRENGEKEFSLQELRAKAVEALQEKHDDVLAAKFMVEFHKKMATPFACLAFAIIGAPIGMMASRSGSSMGFGLSLLLFFAYYLLMIGGEPLAKSGHLSPMVAMWLPNIIFIVGGLVLSYKIVHR